MKQNLYHIHFLFAALLLLSVCVGSCIQEESAPGGNTATGVTINYSFDDLQTRSIAATPAEKKFSDVYFIFYNSVTGGYVAYQKTSAPSGQSAAGSFPLPIPAALTQGSTYRTLIVANYDKYKAGGKTFDQYITENSSKTFDEMRRALQSQSLNRARVTTPLPLLGTLLGADAEESLFTAPAPDATGKLPVSVRFSRGVSRFDLNNMAADRLVIAWVKVCNYRDAGYFYHQDAPLGDLVKGTAADAPSDLNNMPEGYVKAMLPQGSPARQDLTDGGLYAYPNIVASVTQDDEYTTCLMIAGYYQPEGEAPNTTKLTYYRANVADPGLSQVLKRNFVYTIVVRGVQRAGADTEDDAMNEKNCLLDYVVDSQWQDDGNNTVVDENGNFLTVSRTSVILDPPSGEAATIKVSVKEGLGWETEFKQNAGNAFRVEKIDDRSFLIATTGENNTDFVNTGQLEVRATGITPAPANPLKITISITQLSVKNEVKLLSVEGQTGTLNMNVPGQGATLSLQVLTGGAYGAWMATPDNNLNGFIGQCSPQGANKGRIQIEFKPNVSKQARTGTLTVARSPEEGIPPVTVHFTQPPSPYILTVFPNFSQNPLVVEGFSDAAGNPNGVVKDIPFWVTLADPANYTFKVESSFRQDADAFLTLNAAPPAKTAKYTASTAGTVLTGGLNGQQFILSVFRTGPGDAEITGSITVTAVPKSGSYQPEVFSFPVRIVTSCQIGDCTIGTFTVADRNCGTALKSQAKYGLYYSTNINDPGNINTPFKGIYYAVAARDGVCEKYGTDNYTGTDASGWRLPTGVELTTLGERTRFSKERPFYVADDGIKPITGGWITRSTRIFQGTLQVGTDYVMSGEAYEGGYTYALWFPIRGAAALHHISTVSDPSTAWILRCVK